MASGNQAAVAGAMLGIGQVREKLGAYAEAIESLEQARSTFE
jgi:hypothetical protein